MNISSLTSRIEHWNLKKITRYLAVVGLVIGIIAFCFWYNRLYLSNERRFWMAIDNSLSTQSVVRTLTEGGSGNQVTQNYRFHFAPQRAIENTVEFTERSATTNTSVFTEGIIFPEAQYLRYTAFNTKENGQEGKNIDSILGKWAIQSNESDLEQARLNYLSEQVSLAIFGNYSAKFRRELIAEMKSKNVYDSSFAKAIEENEDGEDILLYTVSIGLRDYAEMLNRAFVAAGYGDFPPLSPDNYQENSKVNSQFRIRTRDNTITGISFGGRVERYDSYGVVKNIQRPESDTTLEELQNQVQELAQ